MFPPVDASQSVFRLCRLLCPDASDEEFQLVSNRIYRYADDRCLEWQAEVWGKSVFAEMNVPDIPASVVHADSSELLEAGSLVELARRRFQLNLPNRINQSRIEYVTQFALSELRAGHLPDCFAPHHPFELIAFERDVQRLIMIAENGMDIAVSTNFEPCAQYSKSKPKSYAVCPHAVNAHVFKGRNLGDSIIISKEVAAQIPGIHIQGFGWAKKEGKPKGRLTSNCSGRACPIRLRHRDAVAEDARVFVLNHPEVVDHARWRYQSINNPTLAHICDAFEVVAARVGRQSTAAYKADLQGAFTLLTFKPSSVQLMSFQVHPASKESEHLVGAVSVSLVGNFQKQVGHCSLPFIFDVLSRVLYFILSYLLLAVVLVYVDDLIGVCPVDTLESEQATVKRTILDLLGPNAYAEDKSFSSEDNRERMIDIIG